MAILIRAQRSARRVTRSYLDPPEGPVYTLLPPSGALPDWSSPSSYQRARTFPGSQNQPASRLQPFMFNDDVNPVDNPQELEALDSRIAELAELQPGWLDGDGASLSPAALRKARIILAELLRLDVPRPRIYPTPEGGVQAEWAAGDHEINVTFEPDGSSAALAVNRESGESRELENGDAEDIAQFFQRAS